MREMKDSGIEWIGIIPKDWSTIRFKNSYTHANSGEVIDKNWWNEGNEILYTCQKTPMKSFYDAFPKGKRTQSGDLLLTRNATPYVFIPVEDAIYSNVVQRVKMNIDENELRYVSYALQQAATAYGVASGISIPSYNMDIWDNLSIPFMPLSEQLHIADFLDRECGKIDGIISDIQSQIDTLEQYKRSVITEAVTKGLNPNVEMKDSGIQWIGTAPSHWDFIRGKYILKYMSKPIKEDDGVITCFRDGEVTLRSNRREDGFTIAEKEIGYQGIDVGDLVVHGMDGFAGAIGISDSRGKASPVLNVLETEQNKKYIMYYLRGMAYSDVFTALATGIRVRSCDLRWNKLAELMYPVPPKEEQDKIVEYIDSVLEKSNAIINDKKQQLEVLESMKKSLIYEYVTGKKEVV